MSEMIGRSLGPYRILEQLGMGGMATVYKAYQANMDRNVAVKVLPRHFAQDPTFVGRFEQEAKVIARLEHARILPVYDFGEDDGTTYIVMRYLDAGTLSERILAGRIPLPETARIIGQIAEGLDYAHKKGVIHRDVKPSNIMLDSNGDIYITDFGISKLIEGTAQFTGSGIVGTPDYVSPEQALGQPIDFRSDIYSLGIVLYQMATNDVPFHAETPMAVIIKHIHEPLPLPKSLVPDLPDSVESVILRSLAKNPDDRYQSCGEMAKALSGAVAGAYVPPPAVSPSALPTALGNSTRPVAGLGEAGTLPLVPPPAASMPTQPTSKKRSGWLTPLLILGGLILVILAAVFIVGLLRNTRDKRTANGTATAIAVAAAATPTRGASSAGGGSTPQAARSVFSETFDGPNLVPSWEWTNPPQGGWSLDGGHLTVNVLGKTSVSDGKGILYRLDAPAVMLKVPNSIPASARFSIEVDLRLTPTQDFQKAGLIVLSDAKQPLFTLTRGYCSLAAPSCSGDAIYLDDWRPGVQTGSGYHARQVGGGTLPANGAVTLRMSVESTRVGGEYSVDGGKHWTTVGEWQLVREGRVGYLGLVTASGGADSPVIPAQFDNFIVTLLPATP